MIRTLRYGVALALMATVGSCDDDPATPGGHDGDGGLQGVVARQKTGEGVGGVTLAVARDGQVVTAVVTEADGSFGVTDVADGFYEIVPVGLELAGLDSRFDVMEPPRDTATVSGGEAPSLVFAVVGVVPARITGTVTCAGEPDVAASVRVVGGPATDQTVPVDALGRYAALELDAGAYAVIVQSGSCVVSPAYRTVNLRPGELGRADFEG
ncbi:MAG: hypothetical protein P8188_08095 [Gemmatimonadota bacterium]